jgi:S-adenosylmethionine synthetase
MRLFSSESVAAGHPDKIADQISDAIVDAIIEQDPYARIAAETMVNTGLVILSGEITSTAKVNYTNVVRKLIRDIGYTKNEYGFAADSCAIMINYDEQSPDIAMGVDANGAGDQGIMFGYACDETPALMPLPIYYAHRLMEQHNLVRNTKIPWMRPDAKTQITVIYDNDRPIGIDTIVLSTQHDPEISISLIKETVIETIIKPIIPDELLSNNTKYLINPTGRFVIGGPNSDCGLTGRKIIVDSYGGSAPHGGGAFSGKDPTKVDRSAAYIARYIAKNIVGSGLARKCQVQLAYAIGVAQPVSLSINTFATGILPDVQLEHIMNQLVDLTPQGIIEHLKLRRPIFRKTAVFGHFGRNDADFTWEMLNLTDKIKQHG